MDEDAITDRIDGIFAAKRSAGARALMPFVCGGFPSLEATGAVMRAAAEAGGSVIEVGVPFSDPIADGPVIASAMHEARTAGVTVAGLFEAVAAARDEVDAALVAMVSVSLVHGCGGPAAFAALAKDAGFDGLIVPDAPVEESEELGASAGAAGLTLSLLVAPTTPPKRIESIANACSGFVYLLARSGVTGERADAPDVEHAVKRLRDVTDLPIACGFGISNADQVRAVVRHADAAIVGTALVRRLQEQREADPAELTRAFVAELSRGLDAGQPAEDMLA